MHAGIHSLCSTVVSCIDLWCLATSLLHCTFKQLTKCHLRCVGLHKAHTCMHIARIITTLE